MQFANWPVLLMIFIIPICHRWWLKSNRPPAIKFPLPIPEKASRKNPVMILLLLKYLSLIFLILALARPQNAYRQMDRTVSGLDIFITLDISPSMNAEDLADRSRIDVAKDTIEEFIRGRSNDRIGLVIFSGEPLTIAPLTLDYELLLRSLRNVSLGSLREGTAIGDGLSLSVSHLRESKAKSKVIVLLTDGDNNIGQVDPATAGELAAAYGIKVYSIAIGREGPVKIPIRHRGILGNIVTDYQMMNNALNPELLQLISKTTQGRFYRVADETTLQSVFKEIDHLEKTEIKSKEKIKLDEEYQKPLKVGLFLLLLGQILERFWWRFLL